MNLVRERRVFVQLLVAVFVGCWGLGALAAFERVSPQGGVDGLEHHALAGVLSADGQVAAWRYFGDPISVYSRAIGTAEPAKRWVAGVIDGVALLNADGSSLFVGVRPGGEPAKVLRIDRTSGTRETIYQSNAEALSVAVLALSGDGTQLLLQETARDGTKSLHTLDIDVGSRGSALPASGGILAQGRLDFAGEQALYLQTAGGDDRRLVLLNLQTGDAVTIVNGTQNEFGPIDMSADGRFVSFVWRGRALDAQDDNGTLDDLYLWDGDTGRLRLLTAGSNGATPTGAISADGRFVTFVSSASTLVADDQNGAADVFVFDRRNGSVRNLTSTADSYSLAVMPSANGGQLLFSTAANNLVDGDGNGFFDVLTVRNDAAGDPLDPDGCELPFVAGIWRGEGAARIELTGEGECLGDDLFNLGRLAEGGLVIETDNAITRDLRLSPGNEPGVPFDSLVFHRKALSDGRFLFAASFVDDATELQVNIRFIDSASEPQSFRLLELLVTGTGRSRGRETYAERDNSWQFEAQDDRQLFRLAGNVFIDVNDDGLLDGGEEGLVSQSIGLYRCGARDGLVSFQASDSLGGFSFPALEPGSYQFLARLDPELRFSRQRFAPDGTLLSLLRVINVDFRNNGLRSESGWSDCVRYDADDTALNIGVLQ